MRGLSYSLPVTYYELIPTAPVKYYCKILTVICARVLPAWSYARALACDRAHERTSKRAGERVSEQANERGRAVRTNCTGREFLSRCPYPSGIYFVPARDSIVYSSSTARVGAHKRAGGARAWTPEIKVLIRGGFSRERRRARDRGATYRGERGSA